MNRSWSCWDPRTKNSKIWNEELSFRSDYEECGALVLRSWGTPSATTCFPSVLALLGQMRSH